MGDLGLNGVVSGFQLATSVRSIPALPTEFFTPTARVTHPRIPLSTRPLLTRLRISSINRRTGPAAITTGRFLPPWLPATLHRGGGDQSHPGHERNRRRRVSSARFRWRHQVRGNFTVPHLLGRAHRRADPHDQSRSHLVAVANGHGRSQSLSRRLRRWGDREGASMVKNILKCDHAVPCKGAAVRRADNGRLGGNKRSLAVVALFLIHLILQSPAPFPSSPKRRPCRSSSGQRQICSGIRTWLLAHRRIESDSKSGGRNSRAATPSHICRRHVDAHLQFHRLRVSGHYQ